MINDLTEALTSEIARVRKGRDITASDLAQRLTPWLLGVLANVVSIARPQGDEMFLMQYGVSHASFVGNGGGAIRLDITGEAWKDMGEPEILTVGWAPVKGTGESKETK